MNAMIAPNVNGAAGETWLHKVPTIKLAGKDSEESYEGKDSPKADQIPQKSIFQLV
jgi:hypothetical protein